MSSLISRIPGRWLGLLVGLISTASSQTLRPVISKVEIVFSVVSHYSHIPDRINFYNSFGVPQGNDRYAVPHLVYEPVVTLYNPYNVALTMDRSRVKIWDPPVGFAFTKNGTFLRNEFAAGQYLGLARFQIHTENEPGARKAFTLSLSSPLPGNQPGGAIVLQPGESRTFSTWVETDWTWGLETAVAYTPRSFFDWNGSSDFTNRDPRTNNLFGAEATSSPFTHYLADPRAGFQTDGLSLSFTRPAATLYDFEIARNWSGNWVAIKLSDTFGVQAKSMRTNPIVTLPDFQVDLLRGQVAAATSDRVKVFRLGLAGIIQNESSPVISRTFRVGDILQQPSDKTVAGKTPFAAFTMIAKASALRANRFYTTPAVPASDLYELHFTENVHFGQTVLKPSDAPASGSGLEISGYSRSGDSLFIDFTGPANEFGISPFKVRGTSSLDNGFPDDLDAVTTMRASQSGSGIFKAIVNISGRGPRYFVRIEQ